ncbi:hypothetical protein M876_13260 [Elizabethkingia anophelis FMS-007]|nr:hypothetical protein M876_13260 [Elizabethkingia anophelis FMS-007]
MRYYNEEYFYGFNFLIIRSIKYFDILFLLFLIPIIVKLLETQKSNDYDDYDNELYDDSPKISLSEDILDRAALVHSVIRGIKNYNSNQILAIGIVGEWGVGKTSFMSFIEEAFIDNDQYIIIKFNAWLNLSTNSLIKDFFITLESKTELESPILSKELKNYGRKALSLVKNNKIELFVDSLLFKDKESLLDDFNSINNSLERLNKKILVFFDDLDRLQPIEVFEVLRLIRNTASFHNFIYIVGYHKEYVIKALEYNNIPYSNNYLEKIFQKEYNLVPPNFDDIKKFISDSVLDKYPKSKSDLDLVFRDSAFDTSHNTVTMFNCLNSIRKTKRFLNEFIPSYKVVENEVEFKDFFLLKLLKVNFYDIYYALHVNKYIFVGNDISGYSRLNSYKLTLKKNQKSNYTQFAYEQSLLEDYVNVLGTYNESQIQQIKLIINLIFSDSFGKANSISYSHSYDRYFNDHLSSLEITREEFLSLLRLNFEEKTKIINKYYLEDKMLSLFSLIAHVSIYNELQNRKEYEDFIRMLFFIANLKPINKFYRVYGFEYNFIITHLLVTREGLIVNKYYEGNLSLLNNFVKDLLYNAPRPFIYEMGLITYYYNEYYHENGQPYALSKSEVEEFMIYCFTCNIVTMNSFENEFWDYFHDTRVKELDLTEGKTKYKYLTEIIEVVKDNILVNYTNEFLISLLRKQDFYGRDDNHMKIGASEFINEIFVSKRKLLEILEDEIFIKKTKGDILFIDEFCNFLKLLIESNEKFIDFRFNSELVKIKLDYK